MMEERRTAPMFNSLNIEETRRPVPPRRQTSEMEVFTHDRIRVECLYPIQSLFDISMVRELNTHAKIRLKGLVEADKGEGLIEKQSENAPIEIYGQIPEKDDVLLFSGLITQVEIEHENQVYTIEIEAMSATHLLDDKQRTRSFQNKDMTYTELINDLLSKNYPRHHVINTTANPSIGKMKLQYKETDWEFIKRLATHFNTVLVADITWNEIPRFWFGLPNIPARLTDVRSYSMFHDHSGFMEAQSAGLHVRDSDFTKYRITSGDILGLGEKVQFRGQEMRVERVEMVLINSVLCYNYTIGHERSNMTQLCYNDKLQGVSLLGEVLETRDQEVRVRFRIDEEQNPDEAQWINFTPETNNLMHSMPEIGTVMSVCMGSGDEGLAFGTNLLPFTGFTHPSTTNPDRHVLIAYEHEMGVSSEAIGFTTEFGSDIVVDDSLFCLNSPGALTLLSSQTISFHSHNYYRNSGGNSIMATAYNSQMNLDTGTNNLNIYSASNFLQEGLNRNTFESLNDSLDVEKYTPAPPQRNWLGAIIRVGIAIAAVAVTATVIVATGGAAAPFLIGAAAVAIGGGVVAVGITYAVDQIFDLGLEWQDYLLAFLDGASTAATIFSIMSLPGVGTFFQGLGPWSSRLFTGGISLGVDTVFQLTDVLTDGSDWNWWRSGLSFGLSFIFGGNGGGRTPSESGTLEGNLPWARLAVTPDGSTLLVPSTIPVSIPIPSAVDVATLANVIAIATPGGPEGEGGGSGGSGNRGSGSDNSEIQDIVDNIPSNYKRLWRCVEFARELRNGLRNAGIDSELIEVRSATDYIFSDIHGEISRNGLHRAVRVGDMIFDNLNPNGIFWTDWLRDLGIGQFPGIEAFIIGN